MQSLNEPSKEYVENYDLIIKRMFPCYDELLTIIAGCLDTYHQKILIGGCGVGNEILAISHQIIYGQIHGFDKSEYMIEEAKRRTNKLNKIFLYQTSNFEIPDKGPYSSIISTLLSHLLTIKEEKFIYFKKLREYISDNGILIFTDIILSGEKENDEHLYYLWEERLKKFADPVRISKDFAILRKNSFPLIQSDFYQLMNDAGFVCKQQVFQYFNLRMYLISPK